MAGKGSKPRSCFSKDFKENFETIEWNKNEHLKNCREVKVKKGKTTYKY